MDASTLSVDSPLPDDVPTLHEIIRHLYARMAQLEAENAELRRQLEAALKHRFGQRSERRPATPPLPRDGKLPRPRDYYESRFLPEFSSYQKALWEGLGFRRRSDRD